ncbi:uncharacterized protein [Cardiocondyla obscurior]|uniref:uncharacterized protein n=1 Tax=Cardiocondyla obscurior TaxID=286306 RepID=UPI0039658409
MTRLDIATERRKAGLGKASCLQRSNPLNRPSRISPLPSIVREGLKGAVRMTRLDIATERRRRPWRGFVHRQSNPWNQLQNSAAAYLANRFVNCMAFFSFFIA